MHGAMLILNVRELWRGRGLRQAGSSRKPGEIPKALTVAHHASYMGIIVESSLICNVSTLPLF